MNKPPKNADLELWHRAMQGVTPLNSDKKLAASPPRRPVSNVRPSADAPAKPNAPQPRAPGDLQAQPLDRTWQKRLRRGRMDVDMTLDLHGMTQDNAYVALLRAVERALVQQHRILLVITGKGAPEKDALDKSVPNGRPRGILRKKLPIWLSEGRYSSHIFAIRQAHPTHGGAGAFYVLLRRPRG
ncbi:MAG: Smr/MutS family protein [Pseudomonadota bacterium]